MQRLPIVLSGVLVLQVAAAVALALTGPDYDAFDAKQALVKFDATEVAEIDIDEGGGGAAQLRRQNGTWILPDLYDFPADQNKVSQLLERLGGLKRGLPVAVSAAAAKRFKVTPDAHERRILLRGEAGTLAELLVGSSPSYRQVHVRTPDDSAVYSVAFATYDAGARPEDWMDRGFIHLPAVDVTRVELPNLVLLRDDDRLVVDGVSDAEETVEDEVQRLLDKLAKPNPSTVEGKGESALSRLAEPDLVVTLRRGEKSAITYRLKQIADQEDYLFATSEHQFLFRVPRYWVEPLLEASRDKLVRPKSSAEGNDGS